MGELFEWFYELLYILQKDICTVIEFIQGLFNKVGGIESISINGKEGEILTSFLESDVVHNTFLGITLIGVVILFVFTMLSVLKNQDGFVDRPRAKGDILWDSLKGFIYILLVPILLVAFIYLSSSIAKGVMSALYISTGNNARGNSFGGRVLVAISEDAWKGGENRNLIENMFLAGTLSYKDISVVSQYYSFNKMNFFVGLVGPFVLLVLLFKGLLRVVRRTLDTIFLFLISPIVAGSIPLDAGQRYSKWTSLVVERSIGAYGVIFVAGISFYILPLLCEIRFSSSTLLNGLTQLLFYISAGFAISQADNIVARIIGADSGMDPNMRELFYTLSIPMRTIQKGGRLMTSTATHIVGGRTLAREVKREGYVGRLSRSLKEKSLRINDKPTQEITKLDRVKIYTADKISSIIDRGLMGVAKKKNLQEKEIDE